MSVQGLGKFDLVTAYEVFEHVPDVKQLATDLSTLVNPDGIVMFSTLLSDGNISLGQPLSWWYAAPRNGHISLFSARSLAALGASKGFAVGTFSSDLHAFWKKVPPWAAHILRAA
jgi:2-polyprenyl-3-methyl-5-hydroxy-6-metoxy-1,4-benzoquinol methylase